MINRILGLAVVLTLWAQSARAQIVFKDNFEDRIQYNTLIPFGSGRGSNVGATREAGEPNHANKTGGASVWYSCKAITGGIMTISTSGSSFDTLLAVYTGDNLTNLVRVALNDDIGGGNFASQVQFNVQAGKIYQIAIDGFYGATGDIQLNWSLDITSILLPVITSLTAGLTDILTSPGLTVGLGEKVGLAVTVDNPLDGIQWYLDGQLIPGANSSSFGISHASITDVGSYTVRVSLLGLSPLSTTSLPINLGINQTEDSVDRDALVFDKFKEVFHRQPSLLAVHGGATRLDNGPVRGYSGTQMFSTYGTTMEPGEPYNCGIKGGASGWYAFTAPTNGTLYINTDGSSFDTTLGVYTMPPNGTDYSNLVAVACDNNSGTNGLTSAVRFQATANMTYYVSVDGVNAATGKVVLNYNLGDPPIIVATPQPKLANAGDNVSLSVGVWGTVPMAYQWAKDGVAIAGATNSSLSITNAQAKNAGRYLVSASNLVNTVSTWTTFALYSKTLTLASQLQNQTVTQGADASFATSPNGVAPFTYQWFFQGQPLAGATNASLPLPAVQPGAAGSYQVQVWDANGAQLSALATLTVSPVPAITQQPQSQSVAPGKPVTFTATAAGAPALAYQWCLGNSFLNNATNHTLSIANAQSANAGNYTLIVTNGSGAVTSQVATLTILQPPTITQSPVSQTVATGTSASMTIAATGSGPLTYQWYFGNAALSGATASTLTIASAQSNNGGNYSVSVSNAIGSASSPVATLTVLQPPVITQQPQSQVVASGGASFTVAATGAGPLTYQWRFNGANIPAATGTKYLISSVKSSDYGNYTVLVTNSVGSVISATAVLSSSSSTSTPTQPGASLTPLAPGMDFAIDKTNGSFRFTIPVMPNGPYQIQCSENLREWRTLATITVTNGLIQFQDDTAARQSSRFYRAVPGTVN